MTGVPRRDRVPPRSELLAQHARALDRAAAPALAVIAEDEARAPRWLRPLFAAMRELLFAPDLTREQLQAAAGFARPEVHPKGGDRSVWDALQEEDSQAPWTYLREARLETAANLLAQTNISISEISRLVGYDSPSTFRRPLQSFLGMPASRYRRLAPKLRAQAGSLPAGADTNVYWERMLAGTLDPDEARELDGFLTQPGPAKDSVATAGGDEVPRPARLRQALAEVLAETLNLPEDAGTGIGLTFAEQRQLVRDAVWFPDATFFEVLSRHSAAAEDPERGVELALLAIDSLAANQRLESAPEEAALAWARLARARWRAGDLEGAEADLVRAADSSAAVDDDDPAAPRGAEGRRIATALRWQRGRRLAGLDLASAMVAAHRAPEIAAGDLGRALLLRAELRAAAAELEPSRHRQRVPLRRGALADVEEAHELLAAAAEGPALRLGAADLWARLLVLAGNPGERSAGVERLRRAVAGLGDDAAPLLAWFEGHVTGDAEASWRRARKGFKSCGDELRSARVSFDLARLCLADGRSGEAAALASELASVLGAAAGSPEDLAAVKPLGRAAPCGVLTAGDLDEAEVVLRRLEWQRRTRRALDLAM